MHAYRRIEMVADEGTFEEWDEGLETPNPLEYKGYEEKLNGLREKTGLKEAIVTGKARIDGKEVVLGVCDGRFLMASMGEAVGEKIARAVDDILGIVKYNFGIIYNEDSTAYSRYVTHLRLFAQRLVSKSLLPEEHSSLLHDQIAAVCQKEFDCVRRIQLYISESFYMKLTNQEELYLALHIHRILEEQ